MKFDNKVNETIISSGVQENSLKITQDSKSLSLLFETLITKLYANPLKSSIREIISNAVDANKEAGNSSLPIEIKIEEGEKRELEFSVKDRGIGISPERMQEIYTSLGSSTKRDSNDFIGAFGVGRLALLAYTNQAVINTTFDGVSYSYAVYRNEQNIPCFSLLSKNKTNCFSGTEVKFIVKRSDTTSEYFKNFLVEMLAYNDINYIFVNSNASSSAINQDILSIRNALTTVGKTKFFFTEKLYARIVFTVGGVPYFLTRPQAIDLNRYDVNLDLTFRENTRDFDRNEAYYLLQNNNYNSKDILAYNLIVYELGIGNVDLTSSREDLQWSERTAKFIASEFEKLMSDLSLSKKQRIDSCTDKKEALRILLNTPPFNRRELTCKGLTLTNKVYFLEYQPGFIPREVSFSGLEEKEFEIKFLEINQNEKFVYYKGLSVSQLRYFLDIKFVYLGSAKISASKLAAAIGEESRTYTGQHTKTIALVLSYLGEDYDYFKNNFVYKDLIDVIDLSGGKKSKETKPKKTIEAAKKQSDGLVKFNSSHCAYLLNYKKLSGYNRSDIYKALDKENPVKQIASNSVFTVTENFSCYENYYSAEQFFSYLEKEKKQPIYFVTGSASIPLQEAGCLELSDYLEYLFETDIFTEYPFLGNGYLYNIAKQLCLTEQTHILRDVITSIDLLSAESLVDSNVLQFLKSDLKGFIEACNIIPKAERVLSKLDRRISEQQKPGKEDSLKFSNNILLELLIKPNRDLLCPLLYLISGSKEAVQSVIKSAKLIKSLE